MSSIGEKAKATVLKKKYLLEEVFFFLITSLVCQKTSLRLQSKKRPFPQKGYYLNGSEAFGVIKLNMRGTTLCNDNLLLLLQTFVNAIVTFSGYSAKISNHSLLYRNIVSLSVLYVIPVSLWVA